MLKTDIHQVAASIQSTMLQSPSDYYIKIHKMFKPTPVMGNWEIESQRTNNDIHLMYVLRGSGTYTLGEEKISMKKGQLFLVSNNYPHSAYSDPTDLIHMYSMRFGIYSTKDQRFLPNFFKEPFGTFITLNRASQCPSYLNAAYQHFLEQTPVSAFAMDSLMRQILLAICNTTEYEDRSIQMNTITDSILHSHGKGVTVTLLAEEMGLSTKQFTRVFTSINHMTPHQYIILARINHAKYLLEETAMSIKAIANELGYADAFTFSRQFKKITMQSPSAYKDMLS